MGLWPGSVNIRSAKPYLQSAACRATFKEIGMSKTPGSVFRITLSLVALLLWLTQAVLGQTVSGSIIGTITDENKNTVTTTVTNESGNYSKAQLIPGAYTIEVEAAGFRKAVSRDVNVN